MTGRRKTAPPTRRAHGTGSGTVYATKGGSRWRLEVTVPVDPSHPEAGDRKVSRGGFASYDEAEAELMLIRADVIRGVPQAIGRDTFADYAQRWVDGYGGSNGTRMYIQRTVDAMVPTSASSAWRTSGPPTWQRPTGGPSAQVTLNTYAHLWHDAQSRAAAALDELLGAGGPPAPSASLS